MPPEEASVQKLLKKQVFTWVNPAPGWRHSTRRCFRQMVLKKPLTENVLQFLRLKDSEAVSACR